MRLWEWMTRRALFAMAAAAVLDPEKLLWKPGKLISIPKPTVHEGWDPTLRVRIYAADPAGEPQAAVIQAILNTPEMLKLIDSRITQAEKRMGLGLDRVYQWPEFQRFISEARPVPPRTLRSPTLRA
jgi:hypothetical protein